MTIITAATLNNTSQQYTTTLNNQSANSNLLDLYAMTLDVKSFNNASPSLYGSLVFTPQSDVQVWALYLRVITAAASSQNITLSLSGQTSDYLRSVAANVQVVTSLAGTNSASMLFNATSGANSALFLTGGVSYTLTLRSTTAPVADRVIGTLQLRNFPRRK